MERIEGDGWKEALDAYKAVADDLTVADLCNHFLTANLRQRQAGELSVCSLGEYKQTTDLLVGTFAKTRLVGDLAADNFEALRATRPSVGGRCGSAPRS